MTTTRTVTTSLVALALAVLLALPAAASPLSWLPIPVPDGGSFSNPLAQCMPDFSDDESVEELVADPSSVALCVLSSLPDIVGNAHASSIVAVVGNRIAEGFADGTFRPQQQVTRGQMATFLARALDLVAEHTSSLPDVAGNAHADAISAIIEAGIAEGFADGTFRPQDGVTRGQMATFLARALDLVAEHTGSLPDVAGTHADAITAIIEAGIAQGFPDGTFRPQQQVTRGQMATFLTRALDL